MRNSDQVNCGPQSVNIAIKSLKKTMDESAAELTTAEAFHLYDQIEKAAAAYNRPSAQWEGPEHEALAGLLLQAYRHWNIPVTIIQ